MAWSNSKAVGQWNSRLIVEVVLNSQSGNSSNITVRIRLKNGGNSTAHNNNGVSWSMSNGVSASGSDTFSIGAGSTGTLASRTFNVSHNADGNKTISVTVNVGNTSTSTFGTPGSLTVSSIKLPRIARVPSKPAKPSVSGATSNSYKASVKAPANNGAGITQYQWEAGSDTFDTAGTSATITGRSANTDHRVRVRARNSVGWGPWSDWSAWIKTKPNAPAAPSNVSVARVNDGRQTVTWAHHGSSAAPYGSQRILRRDNTDLTIRVVATVGATATSYTDTSTVTNRRYDYFVEAVNASGTARSDYGSIVTTPAAPTGVAAQKLGSGSIRVSWVRQSTYAGVTNHVVQARPDGGAWQTLATVGNVSSWEHVSPDPSRTWQYRVASRTTSPVTLTSGYSSASNVVQLLAPPNAPTLLEPGGNVDRDESIVFGWRHNPVDTTDQSAYELRYRVNGGSWTTLTGTTASSRTVTALGVSGTVEWQARTKGEHASFSPWSAVSSFSTVSRPEVVIQYPDETPIGVSQLAVEWAYQNDDDSAQSQWRAELEHDGEIIQFGSGSGSTSAFTFPHTLVDGEEYVLRVRARSGTGLWSEWAVFTFETDFPLPHPVDVFPEWDRETGSAMLTFEVDDSGDGLTPDWITVERRDEDGVWVAIATGVDPETSIVDPIPKLGLVEYRAVAWTELPTSAIGEVSVLEWEHGRDPIFVNAGPDFGHVARLIGDQITDSPAIEQASQAWAGWEWPTAVFGEGSSNTIQFTGQIIHTVDHDSSSVEAWKDLLFQRGVVCFRDCQGRKVFGLFGLGFSRNGPVTAVTITVDQVHYIEGVTDVPELVEVGD